MTRESIGTVSALLVLSVVILTGCVGPIMDKGLASLNGKDIHEAYNYIGYPDSVIPLGSEKVYVWGNKDSQLFFTGKSYTEITTECELKIVTNSKDVIINTQWKGDQGGCKPYADGLRRAY